MELKMDGRSAIITGGSLGLGRAIGEKFAGAGANVALVARRQEPLDEAKAVIEATGKPGTKVITVAVDVSTAAGCTQAFKAAESAFGQVDVLVNNAGTSQRKPFVEVTDEMWQADLDLKFFAAIRLARLAFPGMVSRRWGRIINTLNTGAKAPQPGGAPTAVSRAAGMALMKVMAGEGAPHNVLVNAMLVGKIESDQWVQRHAKMTDKTLEEYYAEMGATQPMKRLGKPEEFAAMALLLASDAGSYINGAAINVDGGLCPVV